MGERKYIATKLHQAIEMAPDDSDLRAMTNAPHYVIDRRLVEMFGREDVLRSISALVEAGIARLPYPELVVEFEAEDGVRRFAHLFEYADSASFSCQMAVMHGPALTVLASPIRLALQQSPVGFVVTTPSGSELDRLGAIFALAAAMLMLNIQGIDKDLITARALNAAREKTGRVQVPRHTLLRIGTVVDSLGREASWSSGRHMPLHMRAGHVRHQACGKGLADRKLVYIPPTLVNFRPGDETKPIPQPKRVLTR